MRNILLLLLILLFACKKEQEQAPSIEPVIEVKGDSTPQNDVPALQKKEPTVDTIALEDSLSTEALEDLFESVDTALTPEERDSLAKLDSLGYAYDSASLYRLANSDADTIWIKGRIVLREPFRLHKKQNKSFIGLDSTAALMLAGDMGPEFFIVLEYCRNILFKGIRTFSVGSGYAFDYLINSCGKVRISECDTIGISMYDSWLCTVSDSKISRGLEVDNSICRIFKSTFDKAQEITIDSVSHVTFTQNRFVEAKPTVTYEGDPISLDDFKKKQKKSMPKLNSEKFNSHASWLESGPNRLRRTRGKAEAYGGPGTDVPYTYSIYYTDRESDYPDGGDTVALTMPQKLNSLEFSEYDSEVWTAYRIGKMYTGELKGGVAYLIQYEISGKETPTQYSFKLAVRKGKTLYIDDAFKPPFKTYENCTERCAEWDGLDNFVLFNGVTGIVERGLEFHGVDILPDSIDMPIQLYKKATYVSEERISGDTIGFYKRLPILKVEKENRSSDSTFLSWRGSPEHIAYIIQEKSGIVAEYSWGYLASEQIGFKDTTLFAGKIYDYKPYTMINGCMNCRYPHSLFTLDTALIRPDELDTVGSLFEDSDIIYGLKDKNHWLLKRLYEDVKKNWSRGYYYKADSIALAPYDEFVKAHPFLVWRDDYGQLVCFLDERYVSQDMTEPIVYLYSDSALDVTIEIDEKVDLIAELPKFKNRKWEIKITSNGQLKDSDGKFHEKLFWEGSSYPFPETNSGFVVSRNEISHKLDSTLAILGLNEKERTDFINAWEPDLSEHAYVQFWFYKQALIDAYAPLSVTPKPDRVIRVMMGWKPVEKMTKVPVQKLTSPEKRKGLTLIEWGGVRLR